MKMTTGSAEVFYVFVCVLNDYAVNSSPLYILRATGSLLYFCFSHQALN